MAHGGLPLSYFTRAFSQTPQNLPSAQAARIARLDAEISAARLDGVLPHTRITEVEVNLAISSLTKINAQAGADGIVPEILRFVPDGPPRVQLAHLFDCRLNAPTLGPHPLSWSPHPLSWSHPLLVSFQKVKEAHSLNQWRAVALLVQLLKLYERTLVDKAVALACPLRMSQFAFRANRQPLEVLHTMRLAAQHCHRWKLPLLIVEADVWHAFDEMQLR